jgi:hypothetical protein
MTLCNGFLSNNCLLKDISVLFTVGRYVDVVLELLEKAGDYVSEDVWHRVVQLVTNNPAMQQYAARNVATVLKRGARHEVGGGCWWESMAGVIAISDARQRDYHHTTSFATTIIPATTRPFS